MYTVSKTCNKTQNLLFFPGISVLFWYSSYFRFTYGKNIHITYYYY